MTCKRNSLKSTWEKKKKKKLMCKIDLEDSTPIIDKIYLRCTQRESETNNRIAVVHQTTFIQHKDEYQDPQWHQARREIMKLGHARSYAKVCWAIVRISINPAVKLHKVSNSLFGWSSILKVRIGSSEVIIWSLLAHRVYITVSCSRRSDQDMWRNGTDHATSD